MRHFAKDFTIQMLYGLWGRLARLFLARGYRVALYIPVVLPWCVSTSDGYVRRRVKTLRTLIVKRLVAALLP